MPIASRLPTLPWQMLRAFAQQQVVWREPRQKDCRKVRCKRVRLFTENSGAPLPCLEMPIDALHSRLIGHEVLGVALIIRLRCLTKIAPAVICFIVVLMVDECSCGSLPVISFQMTRCAQYFRPSILTLRYPTGSRHPANRSSRAALLPHYRQRSSPFSGS